MKLIKLNWGAGIALTYLGFVAMIVCLVVMSIHQKIDLVTDQYYTEELQFQNKIDKKNRSLALDTPLRWSVGDQYLEIQYPNTSNNDDVSGNVTLYCPANNEHDRSIKIQTKNLKQRIALTEIPEGRYQLKIDWQHGSETYFNEGVIMVKHRHSLK
jgi:hypothetical protein